MSVCWLVHWYGVCAMATDLSRNSRLGLVRILCLKCAKIHIMCNTKITIMDVWPSPAIENMYTHVTGTELKPIFCLCVVWVVCTLDKYVKNFIYFCRTRLNDFPYFSRQNQYASFALATIKSGYSLARQNINTHLQCV